MNFVKLHEKKAYDSEAKATIVNLDNVNYIQRKEGRDTYIAFRDKSYLFVSETIDEVIDKLAPRMVVNEATTITEEQWKQASNQWKEISRSPIDFAGFNDLNKRSV